jgi:hypothetical protein
LPLTAAGVIERRQAIGLHEVTFARTQLACDLMKRTPSSHASRANVRGAGLNPRWHRGAKARD